MVWFREGDSSVEITEVRIALKGEDKLKAFANVTLDGDFVIRGVKVIQGANGYFVSMPSRRRSDGTYQDICHPVNASMRKKLETAVLDAYLTELKKTGVTEPEDFAPHNV
jgi:stage V sporulation protein G